MYLNKAIERINNIRWEKVGNEYLKSEADLGYEFLRRLAHLIFATKRPRNF